MEIFNFGLTIFLVFLMSIQDINSTKDVKQLDVKSNPLANLILNQHENGDVNHSEEHTKSLSRVKRQFYYDPDYRYRRPYYYYPLPPPIFFGGGGFGFGRGFGGRGFGGRGFGGRGFGGGGFGGGHGGRG